MKLIETVRFPIGAESNSFFAALASALLPVLGYTENTPYYCPPKGSNCIQCGNCQTSTLQKHQEQLYHDYISYTGVALGWYWPEERIGTYQVISDGGTGWDWPDEFVAYIMGIAGLSWKRVPAGASRDTILQMLSDSLMLGFPALIRLGNGVDWTVVLGCEDNGLLLGFAHPDASVKPDGTIGGLDTFVNWYASFKDAIIITGHETAPSVLLPDILQHMIAALEHPAHAALERQIYHRIDELNMDNAGETVQWLNDRVDKPIEDRFHMASCADKIRPTLTDSVKIADCMFQITKQYVFDNELDTTHGTCWKIWRLLGVSPYVDRHPAAKVVDPITKAELKRLFSIVFENDRIVLDWLRKALSFA